MTASVLQDFAETASLLRGQQDVLSVSSLADLQDEQRWDRSFAESDDVLTRLADEALADYRAGRTEPLPDDLR